ncbi:MAG TPA: class I SAM-dependent methyltransferase [Gemmatimonadaceae bacterium]|nr:class I SAM-dependent methyltransferase [Gemmatimonadaceae bacterium]
MEVSPRGEARQVKADVWASGDAYEPYVGRWSRMVAREFVDWLGAPRGATWLDVGCGTGALSQAILSAAKPARVRSMDRSLPFAMHARRAMPDERVSFMVADGQALPLPDESTDVVVSGLVLNFIPKPDTALGEMARVAREGGKAAVYVWDYAEGMQLMRYFWDAAVALDPRAEAMDEGRRFPICHAYALEPRFYQAGFDEVESRPIEVPTRFRDFDDYWKPFLGGQGPAPGYAMSLTEDHRAELRERIRDSLPVAKDGSIELVARAWAVRGTRG